MYRTSARVSRLSSTLTNSTQKLIENHYKLTLQPALSLTEQKPNDQLKPKVHRIQPTWSMPSSKLELPLEYETFVKPQPRNKGYQRNKILHKQPKLSHPGVSLCKDAHSIPVTTTRRWGMSGGDGEELQPWLRFLAPCLSSRMAVDLRGRTIVSHELLRDPTQNLNSQTQVHGLVCPNRRREFM